MAEKARIDIEIGGDGGQQLESLENKIRETGQGTQSVKQRLRELTDQMSAIGDVGSPEFQKLAQEAGKLRDQMNNATKAINAMASDFPKIQLGAEAMMAIGAGAQFAMGAQTLLGEKNEELAKSLQKLMALQSMMNGLQSAAKLLSDETLLGIKLRIALQKVQNKLTAEGTMLAKAFNAVTKSALGIIGLVALAIGGLITLYNSLKGSMSSAEKAQEAMTDAMKESNKEVAKTESKLKSYATVLTDVTASEEDRARAIDKINELLPEGTELITEQNIANGTALEIIKEQIGLMRERAELTALENILTEKTTEIMNLKLDLMELERDGSDFDVAITKAKIQDLQNQNNIILEQIQLRQSNVLAMDEEAAEESRIDTRKNAIKNKLDNEQAEKEKKNAKDVEQVKTEIDTSEIDRKNNLLLEIEKLENEAFEKTLSKQEREIRAIQEKYFVLIEEARQFGLDTAELERLQAEEILAIKTAAAEEEARKLKEIRDAANLKAIEDKKAKDDKIAEQDANNKAVLKKGAEDLFKATEALSKFLFDKDMKRAQEKAARGEELTKSEIKRLKAQDKIQKAFALAQIASDTARGISAAIAAGAGVPFPFNLGAIASGIAAVISGGIQAAQVLGESVEIPSPSDITGGSTGGGGDGESVPNIEAATFGSTLLNQQKVVVLESDITETQNNVSVIESQATFG